jgi:hypothetical protein
LPRRAAPLPASRERARHKHPVAEITKPFGDGLELSKGFAGVAAEPPDALASAVILATESQPR